MLLISFNDDVCIENATSTAQSKNISVHSSLTYIIILAIHNKVLFQIISSVSIENKYIPKRVCLKSMQGCNLPNLQVHRTVRVTVQYVSPYSTCRRTVRVAVQYVSPYSTYRRTVRVAVQYVSPYSTCRRTVRIAVQYVSPYSTCRRTVRVAVQYVSPYSTYRRNVLNNRI